jgi:ATP-binding protein involved in chromosome partitioning
LKFRGYSELTGQDRSDLLGQVTTLRQRVTDRLASVRHIVAVMSGKGGVGKSYITSLLAVGLRERLGGKIGVVDADLRSPTVARSLGASGPLRVTGDGVEPAVTHDGIRVVSTHLLLGEGQPLSWREPGSEAFVWRGSLETNALREFLADVMWGQLELLLVDLPPGSDGVSDLQALVPNLRGAVAVTIPSDESKQSVLRAGTAAKRADIPLLGIVENMSGFRCPDCAMVHPLFPGNAGEQLSHQLGAPLLGTIPLSPAGPVFDERNTAHTDLVTRFVETLS